MMFGLMLGALGLGSLLVLTGTVLAVCGVFDCKPADVAQAEPEARPQTKPPQPDPKPAPQPDPAPRPAPETKKAVRPATPRPG